MCSGKKIVNVVINSNNAISGSTNNNATYNIDWGSILKPRQAYKLHFTYTGQPNTFTSATKLAQIMIDFNLEQYTTTSTSGAPTTMTIGCLRSIYLNGTTNYLFSDDINNPPIYLESRPQNNTFRVQVMTNDATPVPWTDNTGTPAVNGNYILILSFQEIGNGDEYY
jgi:hypothetical protein